MASSLVSAAREGNKPLINYILRKSPLGKGGCNSPLVTIILVSGILYDQRALISQVLNQCFQTPELKIISDILRGLSVDRRREDRGVGRLISSLIEFGDQDLIDDVLNNLEDKGIDYNFLVKHALNTSNRMHVMDPRIKIANDIIDRAYIKAARSQEISRLIREIHPDVEALLQALRDRDREGLKILSDCNDSLVFLALTGTIVFGLKDMEAYIRAMCPDISPNLRNYLNVIRRLPQREIEDAEYFEDILLRLADFGNTRVFREVLKMMDVIEKQELGVLAREILENYNASYMLYPRVRLITILDNTEPVIQCELVEFAEEVNAKMMFKILSS